MKITDIKQQVKRQDRYSVYVDGKYSFSLSEHELMIQALRIGQEFDKDQFEHIKDTAVEDRAYMRAVDLIARRPRSEWELRQYLRKKSYNDNIIHKILNRLSERGLLNDLDFAKSWVNNRRLLKNVSKRRLQQELQQKHISEVIISEVLSRDETSDTETIKELAEKKRQQSRYQDRDKLMAYLLRQGFNYVDIKDVLDEADY